MEKRGKDRERERNRSYREKGIPQVKKIVVYVSLTETERMNERKLSLNNSIDYKNSI
jgi:hypothetical protein